MVLQVRVVDPVKEKETLEEITRKLDKLENDTLPQVDLSQTEFVFRDVKFQVSCSLSLSIAFLVGVCVCVCVGTPVEKADSHQHWEQTSSRLLHSKTGRGCLQ